MIKVGAIVAVLVLILTLVIEVRHNYERHHVTVIFLDDINVQPIDTAKAGTAEFDRQSAINDAFEDFKTAFAEEENCKGFTLVGNANSGSLPYAYWLMNLYPTPNANSDSEQDSTPSYTELGWQLELSGGNEHLNSVNGNNKSAKEVAKRVCAIAAQKGGTVW